MVEKKLILYYFTGTGNSYRVAKMVQEEAIKLGMDVKVIPVEQAIPEKDFIPEPNTMLGLLSPTHGFTAPWKMIRFISKLPHGNGARTFTLLSRAGTKFGRLILPGLEGTGGYLLAFLLILKRYRILGVRGVDMPSNWTVLHPGFNENDSRSIMERGRQQVLSFTGKVLSGKTFFGGLIELLFGLALLPISAGYLLVGRFFLSKMLYANDHCNGCGVCAQNCPVQAIKMQGKSPRPYWTFKCESCMRCMNYCPIRAIEGSYPLAVLLYYLTQIPAAYLLIQWVGERIPGISALNGTWFKDMLMYPYILLSFALGYLVFDLLVRIPFVNRVFTYATPTHYYRRYHAPDTKVKDFRREN